MEKKSRSFIERFLGIFTEVRAGEGATVTLLMLNLFILLTAYLVIKTVREPLILTGGGAEVKSYAAAGQALLLLLIVPIYGSLASKLDRVRFINGVTLFFISNLIIFYILAQHQVPLGVAFFLWVGVFNLLVMAQFWSFANDIYNQEQGERLFGIVACGGSVGAILGPVVAGWLFRPLGPYYLMLLAACLLSASLLVTNLINRREKRLRSAGVESAQIDSPLGKGGGFRLVIGQRYLLLIAVLMVLANLVNTTGEFILGKTVTEEAHRVVAVGEQQAVAVNFGDSLAQRKKAAEDFVGKFYADFFFWVNLSQGLIQLFLVSLIIKHIGVGGALFILPMIALGSYSLIAFAPLLSYVRAAKIFENSIDYSLQNTSRHALFLPTSREVKYKAKAATDTFFVRMGDVLSAAIVFAGGFFFLTAQAFAVINAVLVILWVALVAAIGRHYRKHTAAALENSK